MAHVEPIHKRDYKQNVQFQFSEKYLDVLYAMKCTHFLKKKLNISPYQSGFKQGDSSINQLLSITHIYQSLDQGYEVRSITTKKLFINSTPEGLGFPHMSWGVSAPWDGIPEKSTFQLDVPAGCG